MEDHGSPSATAEKWPCDEANEPLGCSTPPAAAAEESVTPFRRRWLQSSNSKDHSIEERPLVIGVCAMRKKAKSKPMNELLQRLKGFTFGGVAEFEVRFFEEEVILKAPVEEWPLCDALIAFFSAGFPLKKAQAYAALRRPLVFNDLREQETLFDRRKVYQLLESNGVPVPKYTVFEPGRGYVVDEQEDYLEVNGCRIEKPLVEKPVSGEDHNIHLYYPRALGGGSKRLFRKVGDRSSQFYPDEHWTRIHDGNSYIYEELLQTEGTDVKVYTIGPEYAHAEARKSPVVDGKVMRNSNGREVRYPVLLTGPEKEIARKVVLLFGQTICGFDLLRSNGNSYVCDVNGFSFVKDSQKFWDDSATLIRQLTLENLAPSHLERFPLSTNQLLQGGAFSGEEDEEGSRADLAGDEGELMCVVAIVRHGDRTPKQKLKFVTTEPELLALINEFLPEGEDELKLKNVRMMEELTNRIEALVARLEASRRRKEGDVSSDSDQTDEYFSQLTAVKQVLKSHPFHGIYRKAQLKVTSWEPCEDGRRIPTEAQFILKWGGELTDLGQLQAHNLGAKFRTLLYPGEKNGVLRLHATYRHDLKIYASDEGRVQMSAAAFTKGFLDLEGMLTPIMASLVSKNPSITSMLDDTPAPGREGMEQAKAVIHRVLTSDKSFESSSQSDLQLPPAYMSEITRGPTTTTNFVVQKHVPMMTRGGSWSCSLPVPSPFAPEPARVRGLGTMSASALKMATVRQPPAVETVSPLLTAIERGECSMLLRSLRAMGTPKQTLHELRELVDALVQELRDRAAPSHHKRSLSIESAADLARKTAVNKLPANGETLHLHHVRWAKLAKDFYKPKKQEFDTTKLPDIYDNAVYDILHNSHLGLKALTRLYNAARALASFVVPQEYGIEPHDKVTIGVSIGGSMLDKLRRDFLACMTTNQHQGERVHTLDHSQSGLKGVRTPKRHVRTRMYFTSESHIHSLFNVLRWGSTVVDGAPSIFSETARAKFDEMELCYLTHIVFRVLHKKSLDPSSKSAYTVQVFVSPGVPHYDFVLAEDYVSAEMLHNKGDTHHGIHNTETMILSSRDNLTLEEVDAFILQFVNQEEEDGRASESLSVS